MAAIPIPGVNTPTYQTWGAAVANALNGEMVYAVRLAKTSDIYGDLTLAKPAGLGTVLAAHAEPMYDANAPLALRRNGDLSWKLTRTDTGAGVASYGVSVDFIVIGIRA